MESAALVILALKIGIASSVSVMFGWQPMPDANSNEEGAKIEYIVQIEPELAATLQEGQSIPIISDIPDDIGPIGRIRIVVGRADLPRQKLETRFKPWPKQTLSGKLSREGLVEAQHTVPPVQPSGTGRYGNLAAAANSILPPSDGAVATNPLGRALQQGAQQAKNLAADVKQQILSPTGNQLFGDNGISSQGVQNAIDNTTNQLRQGLQRGAQQGVQQIADRSGQQLRQAVDNVGQGARNAIDKFGRSLSPERSILNTGHDHAGHDHAGHDHAARGQTPAMDTILPPSSGLAGKGHRIDQPIQPQPIQQQRQQPLRQQPQRSLPPSNFAETPQRTGTNPSSRPGVFNAPWPSTTNNPPANTRVGNPPPSRYGNQAGQPPAQPSQWPRESSSRDPFDLADRPSDSRDPQYPSRFPNSRPPERNTTGIGMEGPRFPTMGTQPTSQQYGDARWSEQPPAQVSTPEIRRGMMDQPVTGDLQTASNSQGYQQQTAGRQPFDTQPLDTQPRDYVWNQSNASMASNYLGSNNGKKLFPLLLSWVLLTGSVVGNTYLFWSYLDVRNKYHGVVHSSPGRRDRYDD